MNDGNVDKLKVRYRAHVEPAGLWEKSINQFIQEVSPVSRVWGLVPAWCKPERKWAGDAGEKQGQGARERRRQWLGRECLALTRWPALHGPFPGCTSPCRWGGRGPQGHPWQEHVQPGASPLLLFLLPLHLPLPALAPCDHFLPLVSASEKHRPWGGCLDFQRPLPHLPWGRDKRRISSRAVVFSAPSQAGPAKEALPVSASCTVIVRTPTTEQPTHPPGL